MNAQPRFAAFRLEVRVVACDFCGAPFEVGPAGGGGACRYCDSVQHVVPRSDASLRADVQVPEAERLTRLAHQDVRRMRASGHATLLMPGGFLLPWKVPDATSLWQQACAECQVTQDVVAADTLVALALGLGSHFEDRGEWLHARAVMESSLDAVRSRPHHQALRCALARSACRAGDLRAAEAWIAPCDPRSQDLGSDSAWRFTRALIDSAQGAFPRVIEVLGSGPTDIPIDDELEPACAVLRANAWERVGQPAAATDLLVAFKRSKPGPQRLLARRFIHSWSALQLCATSEPEAERRHLAAMSGRGASRAGRPLVFALIVVVFLAIVGVGGVLAPELLVLLLRSGLTGMGIGMIGTFTAVALGEVVTSARAKALLARGIQASALVLGSSFTGVAVMNEPEMEFRLLVLHGSSPYEARSTVRVDKSVASQLIVGSLVAVRIDPDELASVAMELD